MKLQSIEIPHLPLIVGRTNQALRTSFYTPGFTVYFYHPLGGKIARYA